MGFYDEAAATARQLLTEFGQPITLRRGAIGPVDPISGVSAGGSPQDLVVQGINAEITKERREQFGSVDANDRLLLIDATQTPESDDQVMIDGAAWAISRIKAINPAGTPLAYYILVRK